MATLAGFAGAYGGLFSSTVIVVMMILEITRPGGQRLAKTLVSAIVASSISFGIYFAIAGSVFLDIYQVPPYEFEDWQLLAGFRLGLFAAVLVTLLGVIVKVAEQLFSQLEVPSIVRSTLGGLVFGLVGVALPLTMFTGSDQLKTVLETRGPLARAGRHAGDREDAYFCGESGQRLRGWTDLPGAVHRGNGRGTRAPGDSRHAPGTDLHLLLAAVPGSLVAAPSRWCCSRRS